MRTTSQVSGSEGVHWVADTTAWIFISHSSVDLPMVRQVRNYLEGRGAAPLLFHLLSLKHSEEFWPLIEREISARNLSYTATATRRSSHRG